MRGAKGNFSPYRDRTYVRHHDDEWRYEKFDITPLLQPGKNVIAVLVHAWGPPDNPIPGVPPVTAITLACAGDIAGIPLEEAGQWRIAPALEYQPARRLNDLIGHRENRDLREELLGWRTPDFDDQNWQVASRMSDTRPFLPSPLRHLCEEVVYPQRVVDAGVFCEAFTRRVVNRPPDSNRWRIDFTVTTPGEFVFYFTYKVGASLAVDGVAQDLPFDPPFDWLPLWQPVLLQLAVGEHTITGQLPDGFGDNEMWNFGWRQCPQGGESIQWASATTPWLSAIVVPEDEYRGTMDTLNPDSRTHLGATGECDVLVEDEEYAIIFEFPANMTILPRIEITEATAGAQLELQYSERLSTIPGLVFPAVYTDRVILRAGEQYYETSFQYKSARMLKIIVRARGGRVRLRRVAAIYRHYDYDDSGAFTSSVERLDRIWEICRRTMLNGSQDIIMDGPWREQLLYIGDNYVHNQACYHLFGNHEIVEWQHTLYAQGQMADGIFQPNQPCRTPPEEYRLLDQTILWPIQLEHHLQYTGRTEYVAELLPAVVRLLDGFQRAFGREEENDLRLRQVTGWNWVDHPGIEDGKVRSIRHEGIPTAINILYLLALQSTVRLLHHYGQHAEMQRFSALAAKLTQQLRDAHWDARRRLFVDCIVAGELSSEASVHVNLLAIEADLADDLHGLLDRTWQAPGVLQMLGPFFHVHLHEVLHRLGRRDELLADIRSTWGDYLDAGLTTTPEMVAVNNDWSYSVGHPWGTSPSIYLIKSIAGLTPLTPGWRIVQVDPYLGDIEHLQVSVPTPYGLIRMCLDGDAATLTGQIEVPRGVTVEFASPALQDAIVVVSN